MSVLWIYPKPSKGFHYCSIWIVYEVVLISTLPYCAKVLSHFSRCEQRHKEGAVICHRLQVQPLVERTSRKPQAAGKSQKADYFFSWMTIFPMAVLVSFSFCSVHIINNITNVEYFKRWLLLLSSIPMNNTDGDWDKSVLSVHFFCMVYTLAAFLFFWIFLSSIFLFGKY